MCTIDSIAALSNSRFYDFAVRGDGKLKNGTRQIEKLKAYFEYRTGLYTEAAEKAMLSFQNKQNKLSNEARDKRIEQSTKDLARWADNFKQEFKINLKEAYRQLGKPYIENPPAPAYYSTEIVTTGWKNIDAYVAESTIQRVTLDYSDPNGKKAVIKYEELAITINDLTSYDRTCVYLVPDKLSSFMRVMDRNGAYKENLNELLTYNLVCIAYKGKQAYSYMQKQIKPGVYNAIQLQVIGEVELTHQLNALSTFKSGEKIAKDIEYQKFEQLEKLRVQQVTDMSGFRYKVQRAIFPCFSQKVDYALDEEASEK